MPIALLYAIGRLGVVADLLDRIKLTPPDMEMVLRHVRFEIGFKGESQLVADLVDGSDLHFATVHRASIGKVFLRLCADTGQGNQSYTD